uniref:Cytochrome b561 domain-containing protein n=1 Tax=Lotharella oceanica TaxID=641309 RepID=A0A7S2TQH7_9EUKA|mmetsp:Transcript_24823/g.46398  ORF Transcript_24823/g.46398 Transcript_24823/m.46398 type:complete len:239 (+) Transcript_24823:400-1116(+)
MWIAFALLMPGAIFVSRYAKVYAPTRWLMIHIGMQMLGVILAIAGLAIALDNFDEPLESSHGKLGVTLMAFYFVQILMGGLARPEKTNPKTRCRTVWEYTHKGFGLSIVILGLINVFLGLTVEEMEEEEGEGGGDDDEELEHTPQIVMHTIWIVVLLVTMSILEWKCRTSASGSGTAGVSDIGDAVGNEDGAAGKSDDPAPPVEMAPQVDGKLQDVDSAIEPQDVGSIAAADQELGAV